MFYYTLRFEKLAELFIIQQRFLLKQLNMFKERKIKISVQKIAEFLKSEYDGDDFEITCVSSINNIKNNSL